MKMESADADIILSQRLCMIVSVWSIQTSIATLVFDSPLSRLFFRLFILIFSLC